MLGVTVEHVGFDCRVTAGGLSTILKQTSTDSRHRPHDVQAGVGGSPACDPGRLAVHGPGAAFGKLMGQPRATIGRESFSRPCARLMAASILADRLVEDLEPFKPTRRLQPSNGRSTSTDDH